MKVSEAFGRSLRPPPRLSVADWADEHRVLPSETSAEPGRWRTDRTPYMREAMDAMTPGSGVRVIYIMASAQMGKTELILNAGGHSMDVDPGPGLIVQSTEDMARSWSEERLKPMIESTPRLNEMFGPSARNPNNKTMFKKFPGGFFSIAYASSAPQLRSRPIRYLFLDEVDAYPGNVGGEGDPVELAIRRTQTFADRKRIVAVSTPTIKGSSRIERMYAEGDQRRYHLPCPHCNELFVPEFDMLTRTPDGVCCECPNCHVLIDEVHKGRMLEQGEWIAAREDVDPSIRSYHFSALIAPPGWISWGDILDGHAKAAATGDDDEMRVFVNTVLGLPYESAETEQADWERLYLRRGAHPRAQVPLEAAVLTAGVDVQGDRLEVEVVGWGPELRSYSVDYIVLPGDTSQKAVWELLDDVLDSEWDGVEGATYQISRLAVDTGYNTNSVYQWARRRGQRRVMPIKGSSHQMATLLGAPKAQDVDVDGKKIKGGVGLWSINTDALKDWITKALSLDLPVPDEEGGEVALPSRWCIWPAYGPEYFKGLCGEQRVRRGNRFRWEKVIREQEPFDCRVYALAAALSLGLDRWREDKWTEALQNVRAASRKSEDVRPVVRAEAKSAQEKKRKRGRRHTNSSYLNR